jgi:hypothetical protein
MQWSLDPQTAEHVRARAGMLAGGYAGADEQQLGLRAIPREDPAWRMVDIAACRCAMLAN